MAEETKTVIAAIGMNRGDEGAGLIVSRLTEDADIEIRAVGGVNETREIPTERGPLSLRMLPSGILNPEAMVIMGAGTVLNLGLLSDEMDEAREKTGLDLDTVFIDSRASLIMPWHLSASPEDGGVKAAMADRITGLGIRACDILENDVLLPRLEEVLKAKDTEKESWSLQEIGNLCALWKAAFGDHIIDTVPVVRYGVEGGEKIAVEGGSGSMADITSGAWPFTESFGTTTSALLSGAGLPPASVGRVIGVTGSYLATDDEGPFITELSDDVYLELSRKSGKKRCGWLDLIALSDAAFRNGATELAVTDLSALDGMKALKLSNGYMINGEYYMNLPETRLMKQAKPIYDELEGWNEDTTGIQSFAELPENAKKYIAAIEEATEREVTMITVGNGTKRLITK